MPRKSNSLLGFFKTRRSSRANNAASNSDACENKEDDNNNQSFSWSLAGEERLSGDMCSSDNSSSGVALETASSNETSSDETTVHELQGFRDTQIQLERRLKTLGANYYRDYTVIMQALEEEKSRQDVLTENLADVTELHQTETLNLKEELGSTKEMISHQVQITKAILKMLDALQCHVLNLEEQQLQGQMDMKRPQHTTLERMLNVPLVIWATALLMFLFTLGHCHLECLKSPSVH